MASIVINIACPQCGRVAVEDNYYKIDVRYVYCQCCGYNFSREQKYNEKEGREEREDIENPGYGLFVLSKKEGRGTVTFLNSPLTDQDIAQYKSDFAKEDVNQEKSFLVLYQDGKFNIIFGQFYEDFHLSFEEYKEKYDYDPFRKYR
jgi:hypothetical protein